MRWNHDGSLLATCSSDKTINVIDFNSDAAVYTGKTSDSSNHFFIIRPCTYEL